MVVAAAWVLSRPGVAEDMLYIVGITLVAVVIVVIVAYVAYAFLAIPMYMLKGEEYQENVDYSIDDVRPIEDETDRDRRRDP